MPKTKEAGTRAPAAVDAMPVVAATLAGVIYQAKLANRQMKLNIPESEVMADVVSIWRTVMDQLGGRLE
jgi:hypothetical protein